jgi:hypothetical protein
VAFVTDIVPAITAVLTSRGVAATVKVGGKHISENDAPPRIVWVMRGGPGGAAREVGGNPRHLRTRNLGVEAHVWAESYDAAEALLNELLSATHQALHGSYSFDGEEWVEEELLALGCVVIARLTFRVPVTEPVKATAEIKSTQATTVAVWPDGDEQVDP